LAGATLSPPPEEPNSIPNWIFLEYISSKPIPSTDDYDKETYSNHTVRLFDKSALQSIGPKSDLFWWRFMSD